MIVYYNRGCSPSTASRSPRPLDELKKVGAALAPRASSPIAYPAGQDRNFPIFPFYTYAGGTKADKLMREADLGLKPWTSPELVAAAEFVEMMAKSGLTPRGRSASRSRTPFPDLRRGGRRCSGVGSGCAGRSARRCPPGFDLGLFPFPAVVAGGHKPVLSSVGITLTVNARSKHPDLAFEMIKAITGAWGKIEYTRNLGLSPNGPISAEAIAYQMQSLKDPLYPEFLKLQPTGTTRVIFTPAVEEAMTQGMQALIMGQKTPKAVMESVEAASQKAGTRKFKVGLRHGPGARDHRLPAPLAAARGGLRFHGPGARDPGGIPPYPIGYSLWLSLHEWDGLYAPVGALRRPRELSRAGRRRGLLAGHAGTPSSRRRTNAARGRPRLPARSAAEPPARRRSLLRTLFFVPVVMSLIVYAIERWLRAEVLRYGGARKGRRRRVALPLPSSDCQCLTENGALRFWDNVRARRNQNGDLRTVRSSVNVPARRRRLPKLPTTSGIGTDDVEEASSLDESGNRFYQHYEILTPR